MRALYLIPARGGSKGIPGKNIKPLGGKPLIQYSIEQAQALTSNDNICISTDDQQIMEVAQQTGVVAPFRRPEELSSDTAGSYEVILHALKHYEEAGKPYDAVVLLQPTSPFRKAEDIKACLDLWTPEVDMVVSVTESASNPYFNLFEENEDGYLQRSKESSYVRRQDAPAVYEYNGAVYVISVKALKEYKGFAAFKKIKKYIMPAERSVDLDTERDWAFCEFMIERNDLK